MSRYIRTVVHGVVCQCVPNADMAALERVVSAARAVIANSAYQGICDEDVELEQAVAALATPSEDK